MNIFRLTVRATGINMNIFRLTVRATGIVLCLLILNACATPSQVYWDAKVKELCEKDGGITVYKKLKYQEKTIRNGNMPLTAN